MMLVKENKTQLAKTDLNKLKKNPKAQSKWEYYLSDIQTSTIELMAYEEDQDEIRNVRIFDQWDPDVDFPASSCGPATVATIAEYWRTEEGKRYIRGLNYYTESAMINHIYNAHGGTRFGMTVSGVIRALEEHITEREDYTVTTDRFNSYSKYRREIRADRPLAVKFDDWFVIDDSWGDEYIFDYHWTVGVGYYTDNYEDLLFIHDNANNEMYVDYQTHEDIITMISVDVN